MNTADYDNNSDLTGNVCSQNLAGYKQLTHERGRG